MQEKALHEREIVPNRMRLCCEYLEVFSNFCQADEACCSADTPSCLSCCISMQALMSWCLEYCREADERERAAQSPAPHLSTRLDREAPPVQDNPHQVRSAHGCPAALCVPRPLPRP